MTDGPMPRFIKLDLNRTAIVALIIFLVALTGAVIVLASVPPVDRDALTHHLAVPKLYLKQGGIHEIPWLPFSYYPMNLELLYLVTLYFGNDIVPKYIHFGFALLTAWLIFSYLRRRLNLFYALLGGLVFLSIPIIVKLSITVYVDLGLICFSTGAIIYLLRWMETGYRWQYLVISAVCCGLALGTKYNGLMVLLILTLLATFTYSRGKAGAPGHQVKAMAFGCLYVTVALIVFSPWMIKNYAWTGNPLYPLYDHWFNPVKSPAMEAGKDAESETKSALQGEPEGEWGHFAVRKFVYKETWLETLLIPVRIFFQGRDDNPKYFDGVLNPFLLLLPILAFVGQPKAGRLLEREKYIFLGFAVLYLFFVYVQIDMRIRWISPILPSLVILAMFGLNQAVARVSNCNQPLLRKILGAILVGSALWMMGVNLNYLVKQFESVQPWQFISGQITRADYIRKFRPEYSAIEYANQALSQDARILCLFLGNRIYYSDRPTVLDYSMFFNPLRTANSARDLVKALDDKKISNILIRFDLLQHKIDNSLTNREKEVLSVFFQKYLRPLFVKDGYGLYALASRDSDKWEY
jgi:4-amino-4-deoxy-L-arabinose transferase-like glycosyltransferase